jgi:uncharacterized membrane protein YfhO
MREKFNEFYRSARLIVKPAAMIFTLVAIFLVAIQILQTMGERITTGWLVLFIIGFVFWLLDTIWSGFEDMDKISKKPEKEPQKPK